jgi:hypothetical protein
MEILTEIEVLVPILRLHIYIIIYYFHLYVFPCCVDPCHYGLARSLVQGGGDSLQIRSLDANVLNNSRQMIVFYVGGWARD